MKVVAFLYDLCSYTERKRDICMLFLFDKNACTEMCFVYFNFPKKNEQKGHGTFFFANSKESFLKKVRK